VLNRATRSAIKLRQEAGPPLHRRFWRSTAGLAAGALILAASAAAASPHAGHYDATLCVRNATQAPNCGPADVDVRPGGHVLVRVSDLVYRLRVRGDRSAVVITQGSMQLDEFDTEAAWAGTSLRFVDDEKQVRYEVHVGRPRRAAKR
jgi:hypothetical protein